MQRGSIIMAIIWLTFALLMTGCTDAFKDVQLIVNADIFKYTTSIHVSSSSGTSMDDASVTLQGQGIDRIYNSKGFRDFKISDGLLTLTVDPQHPPLENDPIAFNVLIQKAGFSTVNRHVVIHQQDSSALHYVSMIDYAFPPEGIESTTHHLTLGKGKVVNDTTIYVGPGTCTCTTARATIGLKAGTRFENVGGHATGEATTIQIQTLTVDAANPVALKYFPGGSLTQNRMEMVDGGFSAGTLLPAGLIELSMTADEQEMKGFTAPVQVSIQLNPDFVNPGTGQQVQIGDQLSVFSYQTDKGYFQYQSTGTVFNQGGHLALSFSTTHLGWMMVGDFVAACNAATNRGFSVKVDWLKSGITVPVTLKAYATNNQGTATDLVIATTSSIVRNGDRLTLWITPGMPMIIKAFDANGHEMYKAKISDPCKGLVDHSSMAQTKRTRKFYAKGVHNRSFG